MTWLIVLGFVAAAIVGAVAGGKLVKKLWLKKYREQRATLNEIKNERDLLYTWVLLERRGARFADFFVHHGCQTVAVLGMRPEGRRFVDALADSGDVTVEYAVDADHTAAVHERLIVYRLGDDPLPDADCMVVCDLTRVSERVAATKKEFNGQVFTLAQVFNWFLQRDGIQPRDGAVAGWPPEELLGLNDNMS